VETKLILLVEDDPHDCELTTLALEKSGIQCEVEIVYDGAELIDYLFATGAYANRKVHRTPHLILLDLKMPKLDGLHVLRMLKRARAHESETPPPIVVLTSSDEEEDIADAYALGANSYIRKPIDFSEFNETIQKLAEYWLNVNHLPPNVARRSKIS